MLEIQSGRAGTMTEITVTLSSPDLLDDVCAAMGACSAFTRRAGLVQFVRCNKREAETINRRLAALQSARRAAAQAASAENVVQFPVATPAARQWTRRVMHLEYSAVKPAATIAGPGGTSLRFTGWGKSFICTSELAEPEFQGQAVRYAYYA
ncbi:hypothetical protein [Falsiroseomonas selenitidurans]|uniref:Uncharacterized protein n=1 Tax=Falsiroseomonas selenitidurans TaxID=2716335 RepID=A0ABX1EC59_9PROT|nr:hypothetical protein [Falsiroseomonas selenitidurans]NKC33462.1 hypothetical protein [Falsiroseomonas selenitidurans]